MKQAHRRTSVCVCKATISNTQCSYTGTSLLRVYGLVLLQPHTRSEHAPHPFRLHKHTNVFRLCVLFFVRSFCVKLPHNGAFVYWFDYKTIANQTPKHQEVFKIPKVEIDTSSSWLYLRNQNMQNTRTHRLQQQFNFFMQYLTPIILFLPSIQKSVCKNILFKSIHPTAHPRENESRWRYGRILFFVQFISSNSVSSILRTLRLSRHSFMGF